MWLFFVCLSSFALQLAVCAMAGSKLHHYAYPGRVDSDPGVADGRTKHILPEAHLLPAAVAHVEPSQTSAHLPHLRSHHQVRGHSSFSQQLVRQRSK